MVNAQIANKDINFRNKDVSNESRSQTARLWIKVPVLVWNALIIISKEIINVLKNKNNALNIASTLDYV